jgi:hypothetical protein
MNPLQQRSLWTSPSVSPIQLLPPIREAEETRSATRKRDKDHFSIPYGMQVPRVGFQSSLLLELECR